MILRLLPRTCSIQHHEIDLSMQLYAYIAYIAYIVIDATSRRYRVLRVLDARGAGARAGGAAPASSATRTRACTHAAYGYVYRSRSVRTPGGWHRYTTSTTSISGFFRILKDFSYFSSISLYSPYSTAPGDPVGFLVFSFHHWNRRDNPAAYAAST